MMDLDSRLSSLRAACSELRPFKDHNGEGIVYRTVECQHGAHGFIDLRESNELGVISSAVPDSMRLDYKKDPLLR